MKLTRSDLQAYQKKAIQHIIDNPRCMFTAKMGSGKTVITLAAIEHLLVRKKIRRVLIIAPLRVAQSVWYEEAKKWEFLQDLKISKAIGNKRTRASAVASSYEILVINKENVVWLLSSYPELYFDFLVIDESSIVKNASSKLFKTLRQHADRFERILLLTGTPASDSLMAVWSQTYLLDKGERLGKYITTFKERYFSQNPHCHYLWTPKPGSMERIKEKVAELTFSVEVDTFPSDFIDISIELPSDTKRLYKKLSRDFIEVLEGKAIKAVNSAVLQNKMLQICNGFAYTENGGCAYLHDRKLAVLEGLIEDNPGENFLVAYNYTADRDRMLGAFPHAKVLDGDDTIAAWNAGDIRVLLASPQSAAHGLNLQYGGAVCVWYGLCWSLERYQQFNARLARSGQARDSVRIVRLLAKGTVEDNVLRRLLDKTIMQEDLLSCIKTYLRE